MLTSPQQSTMEHGADFDENAHDVLSIRAGVQRFLQQQPHAIDSKYGTCPNKFLVDQRVNISEVLESLKDSVCIAFHGVAGCGKSTFAALVASDPEIIETFPDGVYWIPVGEVELSAYFPHLFL